MKKTTLFVTIFVILLLTSCGNTTAVNNFDARQDNTLFSADGMVIVDYKTDTEGKLIELNIDRLLTIEQMILLNPTIDFDYELEGFTGTIFVLPSDECTDYSDEILIPINIEVGNTRYKYDDTECKYKTIDNRNAFKPGFADEYFLTDTIQEDKNVVISIIVYNPAEIVPFIEIYNLPHTYENLGVYNIMINEERNGFEFEPLNYYRDMSMYEQLYIKHQENEATISEIMGMSEELNLMDLSSLMEIIPLIEHFELLYQLEIQAIDELQDEIGINFTTDDEETPTDETPTEGN